MISPGPRISLDILLDMEGCPSLASRNVVLNAFTCRSLSLSSNARPTQLVEVKYGRAFFFIQSELPT